jgi:hypothetical protein
MTINVLHLHSQIIITCEKRMKEKTAKGQTGGSVAIASDATIRCQTKEADTLQRRRRKESLQNVQLVQGSHASATNVFQSFTDNEIL